MIYKIKPLVVVVTLALLMVFVEQSHCIMCKKCIGSNCTTPIDETCITTDSECVTIKDKHNNILEKRCLVNNMFCSLPYVHCCYGNLCNAADIPTTTCAKCTNCQIPGTMVMSENCAANRKCFFRKVVSSGLIVKGCDTANSWCGNNPPTNTEYRCCVGNQCNGRDLFQALRCFRCTNNATCAAKPTVAGMVACAGTGAKCFTKVSGKDIVERGCSTNPTVQCAVAGWDCCDQPFCNEKPAQRRKCKVCDNSGSQRCDDDPKKGVESYCSSFNSQCFQFRDKDRKITKMGCSQNPGSDCKQDAEKECCFGDDCNKDALFKKFPKNNAGQLMSISTIVHLIIMVIMGLLLRSN